MYYFEIKDQMIDPSTFKFCHSTFDKNLNDLRRFFVEDIHINDVDIQVFVQNKMNKNDDNNEAIRLIMKDVKDEESCTYKLIEELFNETDIVEKKIAMLRYLLENYFLCLYRFENGNKYYECVYSYWGPLEFKYRLPGDIMKRCCRYFDEDSMFGATMIMLSSLTAEELCAYVIPYYYREIGWWDRQFLRDDSEKMATLSASWANKSRRKK